MGNNIKKAIVALLSMSSTTVLAQQQYQGQMINVQYEGSQKQQQQQLQQQQQQQQQQQWQAQQQQHALQGKPQLGKAVAPAAKPATGTRPLAIVPVKINGKTFKVSKAARDRLKQWLHNNMPPAKAGENVSLIAAIFSLLGFVTLDSNDLKKAWGVAEAINDIKDSDVDEVVFQLSAVNIWTRAIRAQMAGMLEYEIYDAAVNNQREEMRMWQRLRDVIANPERYQNGAIKIEGNNNSSKSIRVRNPAGERLRDNVAWTNLGWLDQQQLIAFTNTLWFFAVSRDFIASADFLPYLNPANGKLTEISKRDRALLNEAILHLPKQVRIALQAPLSTNRVHSGLNYEMWTDLHNSLDEQIWRSDIDALLGADPDELGFTDDDPAQSDLISGEYPFYAGYGVTMPAYGPSGPVHKMPGTILISAPVN